MAPIWQYPPGAVARCRTGTDFPLCKSLFSAKKGEERKRREENPDWGVASIDPPAVRPPPLPMERDERNSPQNTQKALKRAGWSGSIRVATWQLEVFRSGSLTDFPLKTRRTSKFWSWEFDAPNDDPWSDLSGIPVH